MDETPQTASVQVVPMSAEHAAGVAAVHAEGIATGHATFEQAPADWAAFDASHLPGHRFVALDPGSGAVLGWVAVSPVSARPVYAGVVEVSLYVGSAARGRGVGRTLLDALVVSARDGGLWTLQSAVFPENAGSLALHAAAGFRVVGERERLGRMAHGPRAGEWRDVLLLERRL
ncbi:GNAT family N-acetyltransferase [Cellulomonas triticagri]|uniref:GNAT family N-acetyltransferase n=1 Tax=Cellulomonas triticagri TaxID=2483352 RepID=UPI00269705AA